MAVERQYMAVPSVELQKKVQEFTLSTRFWTAYPSDKIEHILRYYHLLPDGFLYAHFDPDTNEAIFVGPPKLTGAGLPDGFEMLPPDDKFLTQPSRKQLPKPNAEDYKD